MNKKNTGLGGRDPLSKTGDVIKALIGVKKETNKKIRNLPNSQFTKLVKRKLYKITLPLFNEQIDSLSKVVREITNNRGESERQRVTKSFVVRGILEVILPLFNKKEVEIENIKTEDDLANRIQKVIKK